MNSEHDHISGENPAPLRGVRVIEFSHMVMGPVCAMVLADLGADVIKIEPLPSGDNTRRLTGPAVGFFPTYNRNKRSICVDAKHPDGIKLLRDLIAESDVLVENFRPGAIDKLGLGFAAMSELNPRLIYCACKGFLPGPYESRTALDEVVQMMGGLAYMTGPPGRPLRAGASVNDILGGVFGAVAVLASLRERERTGRGALVQSGLFETNMLLVAQHMAAAAIDGRDLPSYADPATTRPWPIYDVFETAAPGEQVFVGIVTDTQWRSFCEAFQMKELLAEFSGATMAELAYARPTILPRVAKVFKLFSKTELMEKVEALGFPFSPISRPSDMFTDPHLLASGGLLQTELASARGAARVVGPDEIVGLPALPISLSDGRPGLRLQPPVVGEHSIEIAREAGFSQQKISDLLERKVLFHGPPN